MTTRAVEDGELRKRVFESVEPLAFHQYDPEQLEKGIDALLALFADYAEQVAREVRVDDDDPHGTLDGLTQAEIYNSGIEDYRQRLKALTKLSGVGDKGKEL